MSLWHYVEQGGPIMYILLGLNITGLSTLFYKFYALYKEKQRAGQWAKDIIAELEAEAKNTKDQLAVECAKNFVAARVAEFEKGVNTVKIIAFISPLLGLLGTVIGVLMAFKIMATSGMGDPTQFAEGISMALLTTVAGLIVAIPHYIGHSYLLGMLDEIETDLEKRVLANL